jgi:hypothetical protein
MPVSLSPGLSFSLPPNFFHCRRSTTLFDTLFTTFCTRIFFVILTCEREKRSAQIL